MRKRGRQMGFVLSDAYERLVPANHFLRRVSCALDFGFVDGLCRDKYKSADGGPGRPAEPPVRLFKLLLLMFLYQVKFERELERRANDSVSWRWFCGYAPDEPVASHKTLWLFRKRLGPEVFDNAFAHLVEQCISKGLVDRRRYHVDATSQHAAATVFSQFGVLCPCGLPMRQIKSRPNGLLVFRGTGCETCALRSKCTTSKDGFRNFEFEPGRRKLQEECWRESKTARHKEAMKRRMASIEPVFGHRKTFHNLGKSIYRSLSMQRIRTAMSFFALDLEKLVRYAPA